MSSQQSSSASASARADKYMIAEQVGKGSFGAANVVINKETKKKYVLKRIRLARLSDWQRRSSFQELQLVSSLDHPFVVPFVEGWVDRGHTINIVYGYCRNGDLGSLLHSHKGHFSEDRLKTWLAQALMGLEYIHKAGVLHRDIKSSNLFLTRDYDIQIGDFGLATIRDGKSGDPDYSVVGTPHYMSPELLSKQQYDFSTDIWSLGCVMYELTALKPAFNAFNMHGLVHKIRKASLAPLPSQYSSDWRAIIKSMLKKSPSRRPTVSDLINAPCMREAVLKACKRAKQINKHFCYTDLMNETPEYWRPQFSDCLSAQTFNDSSERRQQQSPEEEPHHQVQEPLRSEEDSCQESEELEDEAEVSHQESSTTSSSHQEVEENGWDQPCTSGVQDDVREDSPNTDAAQETLHVEQDNEEENISAGNSRSEDDIQLEEHQEKVKEDHERHEEDLALNEAEVPANNLDLSSESEEDQQRHTADRPVSLETPIEEEPDGLEMCLETISPPQEGDDEEEEDEEEEDEEKDTKTPPAGQENSHSPEEPPPSHSETHEQAPYKVDRVDMQKLNDEAEGDSYYSSSHWCNPSHMSAFVDGRKCDGLEAIPEGSCEETDIMFQSLPAANGESYPMASSPRRGSAHDFQQSECSQPDPRASQSPWGESPCQLDPRYSSLATGSFGVDSQKRLDTLEQILALCSSLYSRGRWHELGHVLNQTSRNCLAQGFETPECRERLNLCTGDRVVVGASKPQQAIVRYFGPVAFGTGDWVGLELETPSGNTDGTVGGIPYFSCPKDRGMFVTASTFGKERQPSSLSGQ